MSASFYHFVIEVYKYSLFTEFMHFKERLQINGWFNGKSFGKEDKKFAHTRTFVRDYLLLKSGAISRCLQDFDFSRIVTYRSKFKRKTNQHELWEL